MKRDMDLVRDILLEAEAYHEALVPVIRSGSNQIITQSHLRLLQDAGYLVQQKSLAGGGMGWRLTWAGHDFLDDVRDPEIWRKTKDGAEKVGSWSVKLLADLAAGLLRQKAADLGLPIAP